MIPSSHLQPIDASSFRSKQVVFFGEQHEQRQVLKAQMVCLQMLHEICREQDKQCVMVLEHFNIRQSKLLGRWSRQEISDEELISEYDQSNEGFSLQHYMPLLTLARELNIPLYGGFPPREWASVVYKQGVDALKSHETYSTQIPEEFDRWDDVIRISREHLAYIQSMTKGGPASVSTDTPEEYLKGLPPAQTLKDTFFAWSVDRQVEQGNVIFAVCGLGHCEYGFGAPVRVKSCSKEAICIVASKSWTQEEYRGDGAEDDRWLADCIVPYEVDTDEEHG